MLTLVVLGVVFLLIVSRRLRFVILLVLLRDLILFFLIIILLTCIPLFFPLFVLLPVILNLLLTGRGLLSLLQAPLPRLTLKERRLLSLHNDWGSDSLLTSIPLQNHIPFQLENPKSDLFVILPSTLVDPSIWVNQLTDPLPLPSAVLSYVVRSVLVPQNPLPFAVFASELELAEIGDGLLPALGNEPLETNFWVIFCTFFIKIAHFLVVVFSVFEGVQPIQEVEGDLRGLLYLRVSPKKRFIYFLNGFRVDLPTAPFSQILINFFRFFREKRGGGHNLVEISLRKLHRPQLHPSRLIRCGRRTRDLGLQKVLWLEVRLKASHRIVQIGALWQPQGHIIALEGVELQLGEADHRVIGSDHLGARTGLQVQIRQNFGVPAVVATSALIDGGGRDCEVHRLVD